MKTIIRVSPFTGKRHVKSLDITDEQMRNWVGGMLIQNAMPNLSADDREFVMTGITAEEWAEQFGESDSEPVLKFDELLKWVTYAVEDDGSRREVDRHASELDARVDLGSWKHLNPGVEFILEEETFE
jgi:hypothetical protein